MILVKGARDGVITRSRKGNLAWLNLKFAHIHHHIRRLRPLKIGFFTFLLKSISALEFSQFLYNEPLVAHSQEIPKLEYF